jgi:hypothetical protein
LHTQQTDRWTAEQWKDNEQHERLRIFVNFTAGDQGRGRIIIAQAIPDALGSQEEAEANARLIALAPTMYDALQAAFDGWYDDPRHIEVREPRWVGLARAAIAKAQKGA